MFPSPQPATIPKFKAPCLPYKFPNTEERIVRFLPFPTVLVLYEMQTAWYMI